MPRTIALGALVASLATTPATAESTASGPDGLLCGVTEVADPEPGAQPRDRVAEIDAGPATTDVPGTLVCTLQVGASTHGGTDTAVREFPADPSGAIAGVATVRFSWPADARVYLCSSFRTSGGSTSYFSRGTRWHTDPAMPCAAVFEPDMLQPTAPPVPEPVPEPVPGSVDGPDGFFCGFTAVQDPDPDADASDTIAEIDAGPAITDVPGTMVCTIQVDAYTHNGPDAATAEFADGNGVIAGVQPASYWRQEGSRTYMCTSFRRADGSGTIYWTSSDDQNYWHTDPSRPCSVPTQYTTQDPSPFIWYVIDGEVCPRLAARHYPGPPATFDPTFVDEEGDVFVDLNANGFSEAEAMDELFYDCPMYTFVVGIDGTNADRDDPANPGVVDW